MTSSKNIITPSFLEIIIYGKDGTRELTKYQPLNSYLRNFICFLHKDMAGVAEYILDTGGAGRTVIATSTWVAGAAEGNANSGIVVGTGTNPVAITDTKLQTQIAHGSAAGQLYYQTAIVGVVITGANYAQIIISRNFTNSSGASITVKEAGLYVYSATWYFAIVRDLTGDIVVANGKTLAMQYYIKTTV